jgi:hypothetical protein
MYVHTYVPTSLQKKVMGGWPLSRPGLCSSRYIYICVHRWFLVMCNKVILGFGVSRSNLDLEGQSSRWTNPWIALGLPLAMILWVSLGFKTLCRHFTDVWG